MAEAKRLKVPAIFWDDHADRCPSDDGDAGICTEIRRIGRSVEIECTDKQLACLRSDAAFYCHPWGPDEVPPSIKRSAKATLAAIAKATA